MDMDVGCEHGHGVRDRDTGQRQGHEHGREINGQGYVICHRDMKMDRAGQGRGHGHGQ